MAQNLPDLHFLGPHLQTQHTENTLKFLGKDFKAGSKIIRLKSRQKLKSGCYQMPVYNIFCVYVYFLIDAKRSFRIHSIFLY